MSKLLFLFFFFSTTVFSIEPSKPLKLHVFEKSVPIEKVVIKPSLPIYEFESSPTGCSVIIYVDSLKKDNEYINC